MILVPLWNFMSVVLILWCQHIFKISQFPGPYSNILCWCFGFSGSGIEGDKGFLQVICWHLQYLGILLSFQNPSTPEPFLIFSLSWAIDIPRYVVHTKYYHFYWILNLKNFASQLYNKSSFADGLVFCYLP